MQTPESAPRRPLDDYDRQFLAITTSDRRRGCGKARYPDRKAAQTEANLLMHRDTRYRSPHRRGRRGRVKALRAYPCPDCNGWHLTKQA